MEKIGIGLLMVALAACGPPPAGEPRRASAGPPPMGSGTGPPGQWGEPEPGDDGQGWDDSRPGEPDHDPAPAGSSPGAGAAPGDSAAPGEAGGSTKPGDSGEPAALRGFLAAHNRYRAAHCAPPLAWSQELAAVAQGWADELARRGCAFDHNRSPYGENLAAATAGALGAEQVVTMWYREIDDYDFRRARFEARTGHFTQVVWKGSARLGCGATTCRGNEIWVCNYDPPGNVQGRFKDNVLPTTCDRQKSR